jgi:hypothetical protein
MKLRGGNVLGLLLAGICACSCARDTERPGTVLVARVDPKVEEGGIAFPLLGGDGSGVILRNGQLYADGPALLSLMQEPGRIAVNGERVAIDGVATDIRGFTRDGIAFVAVPPLAKHYRALLVTRAPHPQDATVWPRATLAFLKRAGDSRGAAYQQAKREGLLP